MTELDRAPMSPQGWLNPLVRVVELARVSSLARVTCITRTSCLARMSSLARLPSLARVPARTVSSGAKPDPGLHCREVVRRQAHEHYLASLLLPDTVRTAAFALRALACEVAGVRDSVSDRTLGMVRVQWWRDTVSGLYMEGGSGVQHPVARGLGEVVARHGVREELLQRLVGSRDHFLADRPFDTLQQVHTVWEHTGECILHRVQQV